MKVGEIYVLNPKLAKLETEINNLDRQRILAWRRVESANAENNYYLSITCMDFLCSAKAIAAAVALGKAKDNYRSLEEKLQKSINELENTPGEISKPKYQSYSMLSRKKPKRKLFKVIKFNNSKFEEKDIIFFETKKFRTSNGINAKDKNYDKLKNKYDSTNLISNWQNSKFSNIQYLNLFKKINNEGKFKLISKQSKKQRKT